MGQHQVTAPALGSAARALLDAVDHSVRPRVHLRFDDRRRRDWSYLPRPRPGLSLADMTVDQRKAAYRLLATMLRPHAYAQATQIIALEDVLDEMEQRREGRHALDYDVVVFGDPVDEGPWGCRVEGHHLSVNVTVEDGHIATTPLFFGAHPARIRHRGLDVSRPLPLEEELARRLVRELPENLRRRVIYAAEAPVDIATRAAASVDGVLEPRGVAGIDLPGDARHHLQALVAAYLERSGVHHGPSDVGDVHIGWAGSLEPGEPHYYRLQGAGLLIEYDNAQDDANHIHTVVRDPARDFDPLARHRALDHA